MRWACWRISRRPAELFVVRTRRYAQLDLRAHALAAACAFGHARGRALDERVIGLTRVDGLVERAARLIDAPKGARASGSLCRESRESFDLLGRQVQTSQETDAVAATPTPCLSLFLLAAGKCRRLGAPLPGGGGEENQYAEREPEAPRARRRVKGLSFPASTRPNAYSPQLASRKKIVKARQPSLPAHVFETRLLGRFLKTAGPRFG